MPIVSSELQGTEKHCSFCSSKGELLVKIKVRACNLLALVNKDSVGILRGFLLEGAYLSGAKKLIQLPPTLKWHYLNNKLYDYQLPYSSSVKLSCSYPV